MKINSAIQIVGSKIILVPYKRKHVEKSKFSKALRDHTLLLWTEVLETLPYFTEKILKRKYHEWMKNEELLELTASEPLSLEEEYEMQRSWYEDNDKCTFIILDKETMDKTKNEIDAMIGDVNLYLNDPDDPKAAEIEIMIADTKHRSKGKGKEALYCMMRYGIEALNLHKFTAKIKMKNSVSIALFEKIGFKEINKSNVFQEIEMICEADSVVNLFNETKLYEIKDY